uniref:Olfactory receptor n=1 Tax=Apolygus lucorum TaxID=248454 RepID=A0A1Q1NIU0_APOLU|nr:olfactory receptor [Apolygus lucorum]
MIKTFYEKLFRVVWEKNLVSNKKLVLYLTIQRKVKFSACGFFTLGCPLFTSIIASATTYLVILLQFDQS